MSQIHRLLVVFATVGLSAAVLLSSAQVDAQELKEYNNPYIYDGIVRKPPFDLPFKIESVNVEFAKNGRAKLMLKTDKKADVIIEDWKADFKTGREIAPDWFVVGHIFLVKQGHMAFTVSQQSGNGQHLIEVYEENGKTQLRVDARVHGNRTAAFRRVWKNFSPVGMEEYSIYLKAL